MTGLELKGVLELGRALGATVERATTLLSNPRQYEIRLRIAPDDEWLRFTSGHGAMVYIVVETMLRRILAPVTRED